MGRLTEFLEHDCGQDPRELGEALHKIAGTAGHFGEQDLGSMCREMEGALRDGADMETLRAIGARILAATSPQPDHFALHPIPEA